VRGSREGGEPPAPDRTYLAQVVATRTGISQPDAEKWVSEVIEQARSAADEARRAAAKLSLWLTAAVLIGAFSASLAPIEGGQLRDGDLERYDRHGQISGRNAPDCRRSQWV
jgi:hypothetical protein